MNSDELKQTILLEIKDDVSFAEMEALSQTPIQQEEIDKLEARFAKLEQQKSRFNLFTSMFVIVVMIICLAFIDNLIVRLLLFFGMALIVVQTVRNSSTSLTKSNNKHLFIINILRRIYSSEQ
jgi:hypothetical protein